MKQLKIIFGTKCNLNCEYCYQIDKCNDMSDEVLDKIIEEINKSEEQFSIHLFGGEPLIYIDKILYLIDNIDRYKHKFSISTNGTLIDNFRLLEQKLGYFIPNLLSNKEGGSYEKLNMRSQFRFIVTKDNISELEKKLDWFLQEYGNNFSIYCNFYESWTQEMLDRINVIEEKVRKNFPYLRILKPQVAKDILCNNHSVIVNWNGDLLTCQRNEKGVIGNIMQDGLKCSTNKECIFKKDIQTNFIMSNNEEVVDNLCDLDAVFYC